MALDVTQARGLPLPLDAHLERGALGRSVARGLDRPAVHLEAHAARIERRQSAGERRVEERLKVQPQDVLEIAGIHERRKSVVQVQEHRRAVLAHEPRRRDRLVRGELGRGQVPARGGVRLAAARLGHHLARGEERQLDADAGEADARAARLAARGEVVKLAKLLPHHTTAVVLEPERGGGRIGEAADHARTGVERVGHQLGEDGFLEPAGIGVSQVLE